jgi:putative ABC transport system ATP-binding protein
MGLHRDLGLSHAAARERAVEMLGSVGLAERVNHHPDQLSGGQKQRVAIARALAAKPKIILADEPTASLDKKSGRDVVDRLHDLAKKEGTAVVLVTHDNRILDVADRIIHLEEGRLSSFSEAVRASTQRLMATLARSNRTAEVVEQVAAMPATQFAGFLEDLTAEARSLLDILTLGADEAFETMLAQLLAVLTRRAGELFAVVAEEEGGRTLEIRIPATTGVAGHVYRSGEPLNAPDAYALPFFNREVDKLTGYRTTSILCLPIADQTGRRFAVMTLLNKRGAAGFDEKDERGVRDLTARLGVVLETWHHARRARARGRGDGLPAP